jgi:beta-1,2-mannosidase
MLHYWCELKCRHWYVFVCDVLCNLTTTTDWQIHFDKLVQGNPVLGPNATTTFKCPIRRKEIKWEEKDVFNPAAVVKDNKVFLLYRAEDTV